MPDLLEEIQYFEAADRFYQDGQLDLAALHYQLAVELAPSFSEARYQLACVYLAQHQPELAVVQLKQLLDDNPVFAPAFFQLGDIYQRCFGAFEEALVYYQTAIQLNDQYLEAYYQMGLICRALEKPEAALKLWRRCLQLKPESPDILSLMADVLLELGDGNQACQYYLRVLEYQPENPHALEAWLKLTAGQGERGMIEILIQLALNYPHLRPQLACQAGALSELSGNLGEARQCYQFALEQPDLSDREAWQLKAALLVPVLPESQAEREQALKQIAVTLEALEPQSAEPLIDAHLSNYESYFLNTRPLNLLTYYGVDPFPWRCKLADWLQRCLPHQVWPQPARATSGRRRVAFLMNGSEAVAHGLTGLITQLSSELFELLILTTHPYEYRWLKQRLPQAHFQHVLLPEHPDQALSRLAALGLDILYFAELNTHRLLPALLAAYRSAPVQCTSWLSAGTTGQPQIDYFLSSTLLEGAEQPQSFYREQLILHHTLPVFLTRPVPQPRWPRRDYGLPETGHFYLCPYELYALQPAFDQILSGILAADTESFMVLVLRPEQPWMRAALLRRFERELGEQMPRIWFLPALSEADFLGLLQMADVVLEPPTAGEWLVSYQALAAAVPVITWPGLLLQTRITHALYQKMGVQACSVDSVETYIKTAVQIATDSTLRERICTQIQQRSDCLFADPLAVTELQTFLSQVPLP